MDLIAGVSPGQLDAAGVLVTDTSCRKCGYNLRGLHHQHRCPECGTPVGLAIAGDLLRFADPKWLATVTRGVAINFWMIIIGVLGGLLLGCGFAIVASAGVGGGGGPAILIQLVQLAAMAISFYGVWLMTEPDPSGIGEDKYVSARKMVRVTLLVGVVGAVIAAMTEHVSMPAMLATVLGIVVLLAALFGLVGEWFKFTYYQILARRIPDEALVRRAGTIKWGFVISYGLMTIVGGVIGLIALTAAPMTTAPTGLPTTSPTTTGVTLTWTAGGASGTSVPGSAVAGLLVAGGCVVGVAGLAVFVFSIMTLFLLRGLMVALRQQTQLAEVVWASAVVAPRSSL